jgi:peptidyl-prolyl cis-trans isomerase B (cyclophilin B)
MTELEELFRSAAALAEEQHPPPGDPLGRLGRSRAAQRRRRLAAVAAPVVAVVAAAVVVVPALLAGQDGGGQQLIEPAPAPAAPARFAARSDGRAGLYATSTGERLRDLGPAVAVAATSDGAWISDADGCRSTLSYTKGAVSAERAVPGFVGAMAVSPDGRTLAYSDARPSADDDSSPCGSAALVLLDVATGTERRWPAGEASGGIDSLAWSADGKHLAFQRTQCCDATTTVHDLVVATTPKPVPEVPVPAGQERDCEVVLPAYQGDQLVAVRRCDGAADLVQLTGGRSQRLRSLGDRDPIGLAVAGDAVLLSLRGDGEAPGDLLLLDQGGSTRTVAAGLAQPSWPASSAGPVPARPAPTQGAPGACTYRTPTEGVVARPVEPPPAVPGRLPRRATLQTTEGAITVELTTTTTPCTVNSFVHLARSSFFDDTSCHRVTTQGIFVVQCGDPTGKGTGGPGYVFDEEHLPGSTYDAGVLAMANSGPGTSGSQFFLVYEDSALDPNYTVFGRVVSGLDVLRKVAAAGATPEGDGRPKLPLTITGVTVG